MDDGNVSLRTRIGGTFFFILSLPMAYLALLLDFWAVDLDGLQFSIPFLVLTVTYFCGGITLLFDGKRMGATAIHVVNLLSLVSFLTFFLIMMYGYFTDPCYVDPSSCDDQLTDTPFYLTALGLWTTFFAVITFASWRLHRRAPIVEKSIQIDE